MYEKNDPSILWIAPSAGGGNGTHENPFGDIGHAVAIVKPGMTIVLTAGVYGRDTTFDISGTIHQPIRIAADPGADVEIRSACWFFYDASDIIVSGIVFRDAPVGAVSVIGACARNRFEGLRFVNCGKRGTASCTLFFGGSGGSCNMVESCRFERAAPGTAAAAARGSAAQSIGLMVSEGDIDGGAPIVDHVFRKNYFVNYDYGILVGAGDAPAGQYGHIVEYNTVEQCRSEGILVKCSDTMVRGNRVAGCPNNSLAIGAGRGSVVDSNRVLDCGHGIRVNGDGHTVANNCIVRCSGEAIGVNGASKTQERRAASNLLIENNTCVDCGTGAGNGGAARVAGVRIDAGTTSIVRQNLFYGAGKPYLYSGDAARNNGKKSSLIIENIAAGRCEAMEGASAAAVAFKNAALDDFTNDSGCGANGCVLAPDAFDPEDEANDYRCGCGETDEEADNGKEVEDAAETADFDSFMDRFYSKDVAREDN
jgi:hypothetical protein